MSVSVDPCTKCRRPSLSSTAVPANCTPCQPGRSRIQIRIVELDRHLLRRPVEKLIQFNRRAQGGIVEKGDVDRRG